VRAIFAVFKGRRVAATSLNMPFATANLALQVLDLGKMLDNLLPIHFAYALFVTLYLLLGT
jgi:hypothetical protein